MESESPSQNQPLLLAAQRVHSQLAEITSYVARFQEQTMAPKYQSLVETIMNKLTVGLEMEAERLDRLLQQEDTEDTVNAVNAVNAVDTQLLEAYMSLLKVVSVVDSLPYPLTKSKLIQMFELTEEDVKYQNPNPIELVLIQDDDGTPNPATGDNWALRYACQLGFTNVVMLLLDFPCIDPTVNNNAPIRATCYYGHTDIVKLLLADPRVDPTAQNNTAICLASTKGHTEIVRLLLQWSSGTTGNRVDPSVQDNTAILLASADGYKEVVRLLLQDPRVKTGKAHMFARINGHTEIVELLESWTIMNQTQS